MVPEAAISIFNAHVFFAETTEFQRAKIHVPNTVVDLLHADILAGAGNANVDPGTVPADAAIVANIACFEMRGVLKRGQLRGKGTRRWVVESRRCFQSQGFVGSLVIKLRAKEVEGPLLSAAVSRGGTGSFSFQGAMHSFMSTVLLWFTGLDQFGENAEADEPGGESREAGQRDSSKGHTVVSAHTLWQAKLLEKSAENGLGISAGIDSRA